MKGDLCCSIFLIQGIHWSWTCIHKVDPGEVNTEKFSKNPSNSWALNLAKMKDNDKLFYILHELPR